MIYSANSSYYRSDAKISLIYILFSSHYPVLLPISCTIRSPLYSLDYRMSFLPTIFIIYIYIYAAHGLWLLHVNIDDISPWLVEVVRLVRL